MPQTKRHLYSRPYCARNRRAIRMKLLAWQCTCILTITFGERTIAARTLARTDVRLHEQLPVWTMACYRWRKCSIGQSPVDTPTPCLRSVLWTQLTPVTKPIIECVLNYAKVHLLDSFFVSMRITLKILHTGMPNIRQNNPRWRRRPFWIFAQTAITQPPIDVDEWNFAAM